MEITFNTHSNEKQKLCAKYWADNSVSDIAYGGSKGSAKSYTGCSLVFGSGLMYPESHWFIARKKLNDLRKYTIPSVHEVFDHWGVSSDYFKYNGQDNYFQLYNNSKVFLIDAKYLPSDPMYQRYGSMQMTGGWIEEAGEFELQAKQNLQASIGRWKNDVYDITGTLLQTCNPAKNYLYRDYYKKSKAGTLPSHVKFIQALPEDNKMLPKGYLENLNLILSHNEKERLLYGNWEFDDDPATLIQYDSILHLFEAREMAGGDKVITADIARFGNDKTVIGVWDGWKLIEIQVLSKSSLTEAFEIIEALRMKHNVKRGNVVIDDDGMGGGVTDMGRYSGFVNNSRPIPEGSGGKDSKVANFQNLATQCAVRMAEKIEKSQVWICANIGAGVKEDIIEELEQVKRYNMDNEGKIAVVPKRIVKEKLGRSPDYWDMIKMRYLPELKPKYNIEIMS